MKIDGDLRAAVRSAERAQPEIGWDQIRKQQAEAIMALLSKSKFYRKAQAARFKLMKASKLKKEGDKFFTDLGISAENRIHDDDLFVKAGGKLPSRDKRWKFDFVISELAAASPKDGPVILARYGIKWV